jgi:hypothetical protein
MQVHVKKYPVSFLFFVYIITKKNVKIITKKKIFTKTKLHETNAKPNYTKRTKRVDYQKKNNTK